jgi:hypothetical protein
MTIREMIMDLWDLSGHASDLYPFLTDTQSSTNIDVNAEGTQYFLRMISQGQIALANWKKRDRRFLRFKDFYISANRQLGWEIETTYTISHTAASTFTIDPTQTDFDLTSAQLEASTVYINDVGYELSDVTETSPTVWTCTTENSISGTSSYPATITGVYVGMVASRLSETEYSIDPTQANFSIDSTEFANAVITIDGTDYKVMSVTEVTSTNWTFNLYPVPSETEDVTYPETITNIFLGLNEFAVETGTGSDTFSVQLPERVYQILRIDDYEGQQEVLKVNDKEELASKAAANTTGTPAYYMNLGSKIIFDTALNSKRWYRFELFQQPAGITALSDTLSIPEPFHQALVFWIMWKISMRERQEIMMGQYRRLLDTELESIRDENDNAFERSETRGFQVRRS